MNGTSDKQISYANTVKARILAAIRNQIEFATGRRPNVDREIMVCEFGDSTGPMVARTDAEMAEAFALATEFDVRIDRLKSLSEQVCACDDAREILDVWQHVSF